MPKPYVANYVLVTMRTFLATQRFRQAPWWRYHRSLIGRIRKPAMAALSRLPAVHPSARSQSGMTLIEVIASALLVALIAIGTFVGFDSSGRASADQRSHAQ